MADGNADKVKLDKTATHSFFRKHCGDAQGYFSETSYADLRATLQIFLGDFQRADRVVEPQYVQHRFKNFDSQRHFKNWKSAIKGSAKSLGYITPEYVGGKGAGKVYPFWPYAIFRCFGADLTEGEVFQNQTYKWLGEEFDRLTLSDTPIDAAVSVHVESRPSNITGASDHRISLWQLRCVPRTQPTEVKNSKGETVMKVSVGFYKAFLDIAADGEALCQIMGDLPKLQDALTGPSYSEGKAAMQMEIRTSKPGEILQIFGGYGEGAHTLATVRTEQDTVLRSVLWAQSDDMDWDIAPPKKAGSEHGAAAPKKTDFLEDQFRDALTRHLLKGITTKIPGYVLATSEKNLICCHAEGTGSDV